MTESATEIVIVPPGGLEVAPPTGPTPYWVYLASLGSDESRRTMATCLSHIAQVIGNCKAEEFPWHQLRYEHTTVIRAAIVAEGKSPSRANKHLSALRGVLREAWRLGMLPAEDYQRAIDVRDNRVRSKRFEMNVVVVTETGQGRFQQEVRTGTHLLLADEPIEVGGLDSGPGPYDFLLAALGACTAMTLRLYAKRKALTLDKVTVQLSHSKIHAADCANCETKEGMLDRINCAITLSGDLDESQRVRLMEIADKCPVHRTLTSEIQIRVVE